MFLRCGAQFWPALAASCVVGFLLVPDALVGEYILLPLGGSCWYPTLRTNSINTPAWVAGAMLLNSVLFLPVRDALRDKEAGPRLRAQLLGISWLLTLWRAVDSLGMRVLLLDRIVAQIFLRAQTPAFLAGIMLATLHLDRDAASRRSNLARSVAVAAAAALAAGCLIPIPLDAGPPPVTGLDYVWAWIASGATLPLWMVLVWGLATDEGTLWQGLLGRALAAVSACRYTALMVQQLAWIVAERIVGRMSGEHGDAAIWAVFAVSFSVLTIATHVLISVPISRIVRRRLISPLPLPLASDHDKPLASDMGTTKPGRMERLQMYYFSMVLVVAVFVVCQLSAGTWVTLVDLTGLTELAKALEGLSWLLLIPMPALVQGLLGLVLFPAVAQPTVPPLAEQLAAAGQRQSSTGEEDGTRPKEFRIHFRIVTRGEHWGVDMCSFLGCVLG